VVAPKARAGGPDMKRPGALYEHPGRVAGGTFEFEKVPP
jgi:hypothetical protein